MVARDARQARHTRARPEGRPLEGETVRLMAATSGGPKGAWPPRQRSWLPATRAQAASRPASSSGARSPAPRQRWTVWRDWPHRPPRRCPAIRSGSPVRVAAVTPSARESISRSSPRNRRNTASRLRWRDRRPPRPKPTAPEAVVSVVIVTLLRITSALKGVSANRGAQQWLHVVFGVALDSSYIDT